MPIKEPKAKPLTEKGFDEVIKKVLRPIPHKEGGSKAG